MRKRRSIHERREEIKAQIEKLQAKEKELAVRDKAQERKARTKRLIEIGAVVEKVYGKAIVKELLPYLEKFLVGQNERGNYFSNALDEGNKKLESKVDEDTQSEVAK